MQVIRIPALVGSVVLLAMLAGCDAGTIVVTPHNGAASAAYRVAPDAAPTDGGVGGGDAEPSDTEAGGDGR